MNNTLLRILTTAVLAFTCLPRPSFALTATVQVNGFSFSMGSADTSANFTLLFTTFDGLTSIPLVDCVGNLCTVSQEFSPVTPGSTSYRSDYFAIDAVGVFEYGSLFVTISAVDSDADGILDVFERSLPGNFTFNGSTMPDFNTFGIFVSSTFSGSVVRNPGSFEGTYSGISTTPTQSASFAGRFALSGVSGTVDYIPGSTILSWNLSQPSPDGTIRTFTGDSQIDRQDVDTIVIPAFSLADSLSGLSLDTLPVTLRRMGDTFRGTIELVDGDPVTSWPDYTTYQVELVDPNDRNSDGLPDISFVPEPGPVSQALFTLVAAMFLRCRATRHATRV